MLDLDATITYDCEASVGADEVIALYRAAGLRRPVDTPDRIERMLRNSDLIVCARQNGRLVGIARALTDWSYCCYLSDLAVHPDFQRQGVGRALIGCVQAEVGPQSCVVLLAAPAAQDYYGHIGFDKVDNGWIVPRKQ